MLFQLCRQNWIHIAGLSVTICLLAASDRAIKWSSPFFRGPEWVMTPFALQATLSPYSHLIVGLVERRPPAETNVTPIRLTRVGARALSLCAARASPSLMRLSFVAGVTYFYGHVSLPRHSR